jgi:hypothetical protein
MTKRETIIQSIKTRLETILTGNGYATNAGQNVYIDRTAFDDNETKPFINIDENEDTLIEESYHSPGAKLKLSLPISIEAFNSCNPLSPSSKGHELIGDIKKCLWSVKWSDPVVKFQYQGSTIAQHESGSGLVSVSVNAEIIYVETIGNPEE